MKFFDLHTSADLFRKLQSDFAALEASYEDTWAAFNFFVTAEHLPDWLDKRKLVKQHAILRVVSHLANGAKHFQIDVARHKSVVASEKDRYAEEGCFEPGFVEEPLLIHLSPEEEREIGVSVIDSLTLARQVLEFWEPYVKAA